MKVYGRKCWEDSHFEGYKFIDTSVPYVFYVRGINSKDKDVIIEFIKKQINEYKLQVEKLEFEDGTVYDVIYDIIGDSYEPELLDITPKKVSTKKIPAEFKGVFGPSTRTKIIETNDDGSFVVKGTNVQEDGEIDSYELLDLLMGFDVNTDNYDFIDSYPNEVTIKPKK